VDSRYAIRAGRSNDFAAVIAIEHAAAARFLEVGIALPDDDSTIADLEEARVAGRLWVAADADDRPVGFAFVEIVDGAAHLEEIDVDAAHARRGIGAALVETVSVWARAAGYPAVTLTTARDVSWNAPWYARLGFRVVAEDEWTRGLRAIRAAEIERGLTHARVVMRRDVAR
jgi:GNAT superfamily N-acetyltransferase